MKMNKKFMSGALASLVLVSSVAAAAPATKNLVANYGVTLNVNGSNFTVSDDSMRPFTTQDGRTYVSIAALSQMGVATVNYIPATKTVQIKGAGANDAAYQAQINAQTAENSRLLTENNKLKQEIEELKKGTKPGTTTGNKLSDLSSSDRRSVERELNDEIRYLRANTTFDRSQRFEGSASIGTKDVTFNLYPYGGDYNKVVVENWNTMLSNRTQADRLDDDYEYFMGEIKSMVAGYLKGYGEYNIYVNIYAGKDMKSGQLMVEADYNYAKDRESALANKVSVIPAS